MARSGFTIEKLIDLTAENGNKNGGIQILFGSGAPGGDTGEQDDAPIGSGYFRTDGKLYTKITDTNTTADWELKAATAALGNWRPERVDALTGDVLGAGNTDPTSWTDNDDGTDDSAFTIGNYVLDGNCDLWEITGISAPNITLAAAASAPATDDMFAVRYYMPDPAGQENQAIVTYDGSACIKVADVDWEIANAIYLTAGYAAANGTIAASENVNSAIQKLDGNQQDIQSASGLAQGDVNYGAFTGDILTDNQTSKQLFQEVENELDQLTTKEATGITAAVTLDEVNVDDVCSVQWLVCTFEEATPANKKSGIVHAMHNGTASADATTTDDTVYGVIRVGSNYNVQVSTDVNGAGASQTMRLRIASSTAGITATCRRITVQEP